MADRDREGRRYYDGRQAAPHDYARGEPLAPSHRSHPSSAAPQGGYYDYDRGYDARGGAHSSSSRSAAGGPPPLPPTMTSSSSSHWSSGARHDPYAAADRERERERDRYVDEAGSSYRSGRYSGPGPAAPSWEATGNGVDDRDPRRMGWSSRSAQPYGDRPEPAASSRWERGDGPSMAQPSYHAPVQRSYADRHPTDDRYAEDRYAEERYRQAEERERERYADEQRYAARAAAAAQEHLSPDRYPASRYSPEDERAAPKGSMSISALLGGGPSAQSPPSRAAVVSPQGLRPSYRMGEPSPPPAPQQRSHRQEAAQYDAVRGHEQAPHEYRSSYDSPPKLPSQGRASLPVSPEMTRAAPGSISSLLDNGVSASPRSAKQERTPQEAKKDLATRLPVRPGSPGLPITRENGVGHAEDDVEPVVENVMLPPKSSKAKAARSTPAKGKGRASRGGTRKAPSFSDDEWDSDLETDLNKPMWQAEIQAYASELVERRAYIADAYEAVLQERQEAIGQRLSKSYAVRHAAVMRRVVEREAQEKKQREARRKSRREAARKQREREVEAELLNTLDEEAAATKAKGKAKAKGVAKGKGKGKDTGKASAGAEAKGKLLKGAKGTQAAKREAAVAAAAAAAAAASEAAEAGLTKGQKKWKRKKAAAAAAKAAAAAAEADAAEREEAEGGAADEAGADVTQFDADQTAADASAIADETMASESRAQSPDSVAEDSGYATGIIPIDERRELALAEAHKKVWVAIAKRDIPKVYRLVQASSTNKAAYWRRVSTVVQREAKRGAARSTTTKSAKDTQMRARKVMREMLVYWKRNEKEEKEMRKKAEKEAAERAKKEEEMREAKRQARKLNFLITQTELYSHFVGNKLKTSEAEDSEETSGGAAKASSATAPVPLAAAEADGAGGEAGELQDIDFDDDDEANLRAHARRNAQDAVAAAKQKAQAFDAHAAEERRKAEEALAQQDGQPADGGGAQRTIGQAFDSDDLNFLNPSSMGATEVKQPKMLTCQLKEYQIKGLTWLANLYEQGINGILADEMGLGKTVQSISLMAYLAEVHNIWGPFLVIAPASTLHNWQQEITRFVPQLKALPYWGNVKDRAVLRKFWNRKQSSYHRDAPFHVLVTSYQLVVTDEKYFQRLKWQYMILDEAQAIKSSSSARWKTLLGFDCRNRLLLTGTPVQNSMQELWALLHFIMPSLFDSHDEFSEWFSKDIESHAENRGTLNEHQLRRLHMILKPFMLRRIKKNVQNELGDKIEIDVPCDLSARQRALYRGLRSHISIAELMDKATANDEAGLKSLMNLVMQFRKVCNHPELFERADVEAPFVFGSSAQSGSLAREGEVLYCPDSISSLIKYEIPKLFVREGGVFDLAGEKSRKGFDTRYLDNLLNVWRAPHIHRSLDEDNSAFAVLSLMDVTPAHAQAAFHGPALASLLEEARVEGERAERGHLLHDDDFAASSTRPCGLITRPIPTNSGQPPSVLQPLTSIAEALRRDSPLAQPQARSIVDPAVAPPIEVISSNGPFTETRERSSRDLLVSKMLYGLTPSEREDEDAVANVRQRLPDVHPNGVLASSPADQLPGSTMSVPRMVKLIVDSGKLAKLDSLLRELKAGGHRVLIYFQMTRMIDLMEEYLIFRQYKYLRLDGASKISDRRDMVTDWQTKPELFVFLLSTRAGGLGINLTAADTVIFYDHDWNPSNDQQAMDRAHRLGQTRQVTVYRLITSGTIDERIVKLARAKKEVQDLVVGEGQATGGVAKPQEIVSLLLDDEELAESMLNKKQLEEAAAAQAKGEAARNMHAKRRNNKAAAAAAANSSPAPGAMAWSLDDDEDDFFGAKPPTREAAEDSPAPAAGKGKKKGAAAAAANGTASGSVTPAKRARKSGGAATGDTDSVDGGKPKAKKAKASKTSKAAAADGEGEGADASLAMDEA